MALQQWQRRFNSKHNEERVGRGNTLNMEEKEKEMCFYKGARVIQTENIRCCRPYEFGIQFFDSRISAKTYKDEHIPSSLSFNIWSKFLAVN